MWDLVSHVVEKRGKEEDVVDKTLLELSTQESGGVDEQVESVSVRKLPEVDTLGSGQASMQVAR